MRRKYLVRLWSEPIYWPTRPTFRTLMHISRSRINARSNTSRDRVLAYSPPPISLGSDKNSSGLANEPPWACALRDSRSLPSAISLCQFDRVQSITTHCVQLSTRAHQTRCALQIKKNGHVFKRFWFSQNRYTRRRYFQISSFWNDDFF